MKMSEQVSEIAKGLAKMKTEMKSASKDSKNSQFSNTPSGGKYASYDAMIEAIEECSSKYGISVIQDCATSDKSVSVTTMILHESGQWIESSPFTIHLTKNDPQALGSACTYALKYSLRATLGIRAGGDDDGENAMDRISSSEKEILNQIILELEENGLREKILKNMEIKDLSQMNSEQFKNTLRILRQRLDEKKAKLTGNPGTGANS